MSQKIRVGNDIAIQWSLIDAEGYPYDLGNRDISIEIVVAEKKRVRIKNVETVGNTAKFVYYGKDQKYTGRCDLKFIENDGEVEMVTFDTKDAFTLVAHSWLAVDEGETPETIQLEFVTVTSELMEKIGPPGFSPIANVMKVDDAATITITDKNGTTTATVHDGSDATVTREKVVEVLGGFPVLEETDPTVPNWAKQENKPAYTPQEVGALPAGTELKDLPTDSGHRTVSDAEKASWITKTVSDLTNYYLKSETYTKAEIAQILSVITTGFWQSVPSLPTASADTFGFKIYLVPSPDPKVQNQKDEYITVRNGSEGNYTYSWEQIGSTAIDLSGFVTTEALNAALANYVSSDAFQQALSGKQDTLVSGTNIKTINNESILGGGNIQIQGGDPNAVKYTEQTLTDAQKTQARTNIGAGTYDKPSSGIPSRDLASAVQTSLGKADTAYQKPANGIPAADIESGVIPDAVSANPTVPSGTTPTALTGLKIGSNYYDIEAGGGTVTDVTVGGTSVVNASGVAEVPAIPETVQAQEIEIDSAPTANSSNLVTSGGVASALAGKYTKPAGGIPSTDLADPESVFIIPINAGTQTVDSSVTYQDIVDAYNAGKVFAFSSGKVGGIIPATQYGASNGEYAIIAEYIMSVSSGGIEGASFALQATSSALTFTMTPQELDVPEISTDINADATSDAKTASPKAVKTFVEGKGYGTYSKPSGGIPSSDLAPDVVPVIPVDTAIPSGGLGANVHYALGTLTGSVSITLDTTTEVSGQMNIYSLVFTAGATAPTITWPASITKWAGNCLDSTTLAPVITGGNTYEVSIVDGLAVITEFVA